MEAMREALILAILAVIATVAAAAFGGEGMRECREGDIATLFACGQHDISRQ